MNVLLSSVGRRPYLVQWFQEALRANSLEGQVIAADADPLSPSRAFADDFVKAPSVEDPKYRAWLSDLLADRKIGLAVSINDFELSEWALLPNTNEWNALVRLSPSCQALVEDKYEMSTELDSLDLPSPKTWLGSDISEAIETAGCYVTKGRFGSASRGLNYTDSAGLEAATISATEEVTTRQGRLAHEQSEFQPRDLVIVQDQIEGSEFGLDIVCDLEGRYAGVLARRKIAMRAGETDRAESVDSKMFEDIARRIAQAVPHPGTIDVDVIVDLKGKAFVIDVNPRFGGGYPFSHLAGARIPNAYVAWASGRPILEEWLRYEIGVISGKCVETVRIS